VVVVWAVEQTQIPELLVLRSSSLRRRHTVCEAIACCARAKSEVSVASKDELQSLLSRRESAGLDSREVRLRVIGWGSIETKASRLCFHLCFFGSLVLSDFLPLEFEVMLELSFKIELPVCEAVCHIKRLIGWQNGWVLESTCEF